MKQNINYSLIIIGLISVLYLFAFTHIQYKIEVLPVIEMKEKYTNFSYDIHFKDKLQYDYVLKYKDCDSVIKDIRITQNEDIWSQAPAHKLVLIKSTKQRIKLSLFKLSIDEFVNIDKPIYKLDYKENVQSSN